MDMITLAMAKAYTDQKAGYTEPGKAIFNIALTDGSNYDVVVTGKELTVGETYTVITESGSFSAVCKDFNGGALLGNLASINPSGENTGESFAVYVGVDKGEAFGVAVDQNGGSFIKITTPETIHPIDPKFLPGVCLPVVEIASAPYPESGTVELSAEESAKLDAAVAEGFPVVVKMTMFGMPVAVVCTYLGGEMLNGFVVENSIGFAKDDTVWKMGEV